MENNAQRAKSQHVLYGERRFPHTRQKVEIIIRIQGLFSLRRIPESLDMMHLP